MSGQVQDAEGSQRRERAAIAAQACANCRSRKTKCDERRPKCSLCERINMPCVYREPVPTKKDKTMAQILDTVERVEKKLDRLGPTMMATSGSPESSTNTAASGISIPSPPALNQASENEVEVEDEADGRRQRLMMMVLPQKAILWPAVYAFLAENANVREVRSLWEEGASWLLKKELYRHLDRLPSRPALVSQPVPIEMSGASNAVIFPGLDHAKVQQLCDAYFQVFHVVYPIIDRDAFMQDVMERLLPHGFPDDDIRAVLALTVFALGQLAYEGVFGTPISNVNGTLSGFRGGTSTHAPGLEFFNEARKRLGFVLTTVSLENAQLMLLQATYYEACARHMDFWRCVVSASLAIQGLIKADAVDWNSQSGDLTKRVFWCCVLNEDLYHVELDFPNSNIGDMAHDNGEWRNNIFQVYSGSPPVATSGQEVERDHFQYHFLALSGLRHHVNNIKEAVHTDSHFGKKGSWANPPVSVLKELARQLQHWRSTLPEPLQWSSEDRMEFPQGHGGPNGVFYNDQGAAPGILFPHNVDIMTAHLRTRYYHAKFLIYQPFLYKVLHYPERMSEDDEAGCVEAIKAALLWPILFAPPKNKKRVVPHLFAWTQNIVSILLILRMAEEKPDLKRIVDTYIGWWDVHKTADLIMDWLHDVSQVDATATWTVEVLDSAFEGAMRPDTTAWKKVELAQSH